MLATFIGATVGLVAGNYIYQAFCISPDWAIATERSAFQLVAIALVSAALALRSIAP